MSRGFRRIVTNSWGAGGLRVVLGLAALLLGSATIFSFTHTSRSGGLAWSAFIVLAIGAGVQLYLTAKSALIPKVSSRSSESKALLRNSLGRWFQSRILTAHYNDVSLHVWEVPVGYRLLIPYRLRRRLKESASQNVVERRGLRPRLRVVAQFRLSDHQASGVTFRKGYGLVGRCLSTGNRTPLFVDFQNADTRRALAAGRDEWTNNTPLNITHGLRFEDAEKISARYSRAVAICVTDPRTNEAIGVLTMEVQSGSTVNLKAPSLLAQLSILAELLGPMLAIRQES